MDVKDADQLFNAEFWPVNCERAVVTVTPNTPVHMVMSHLSLLRDDIAWRDVDGAIGRALTALETVPKGLSIGDERAALAAKELKILTKTLDNLSQSSGESRGDELRKILFDENTLPDAVSGSAFAFIAQELQRATQSISTFSLILFADTDHSSEVIKSFDSERAAWMDALRPRVEKAKDSHLAVIISPMYRKGILDLATLLGVRENVPCVAFIGGNISAITKPSHLANQIVTRLACQSLVKPGASYPEQLHRIYDSVYKRGALFPGTASASIADKLMRESKKQFKASTLIKLFAGAFLGGGSVKAIEAIEKASK